MYVIISLNEDMCLLRNTN